MQLRGVAIAGVQGDHAPQKVDRRRPIALLVRLQAGVVVLLKLPAIGIAGRLPAARGGRLQHLDKVDDRREASLWVFGQRPPQHFRHGRRQIAVDGVDVGRRLVNVLEHQPLQRVGLERRAAAEGLEEDHGQAILVAAAVERRAHELLRAHVGRRAQYGVAGQVGRRVAHLGDTEVGDVGVALLVKEDVDRLDVAMDDFAVVGIVQRQGDLAHDDQQHRPRHLAVHQPVVERAAAQQAHD